MANTDLSQSALGESPIFQSRVKTALLKKAQEVIDESPAPPAPPDPPNHAERAAFADKVMANPGGMAAQISPFLSIRTSVIAFETIPVWPGQYANTLAGDPDIEAQILADWDELLRIFG